MIGSHLREFRSSQRSERWFKANSFPEIALICLKKPRKNQPPWRANIEILEESRQVGVQWEREGWSHQYRLSHQKPETLKQTRWFLPHFSSSSTHLNPSPLPPQSSSQLNHPLKIHPDGPYLLDFSSRPEILSNYQKHDKLRSENKINL